SLKALFIPVDGIGHVNACIGIAEQLITAGHRGKLKHYGIDKILYPPLQGRQDGSNAALDGANMLRSCGIISSAGPLDTMVAWVTKLVPHCIRDSRLMDTIVDKAIADLQPDVIFIDQVVAMASVERSGIPWLYDERTPPPGLVN
ncbi:unnamed protein product, partial [Medioppia subpectinata]